MNWAKVKTIVALTVLGLAALFVALREIHPRIVASYWRRQLAATADDRVEIVIRQIGESGKSGVPLLVEALGADRECVAQSAKQELFVQLEHWRMLSVSDYSARLTALAETLAEQVDHFDSRARRDAMDLAARMLLHPINAGQADQNKLLTASEKVLRIGLNTKIELGRLRSADLADAAWTKNDDPLADSPSPLPEESESIAQPLADLTPLSGDGLPGKSDLSPVQLGEDEAQTADAQANQPWLLGRPAELRSLGSLNQPSRASLIPDHAGTAADNDRGMAKDKQSSATDRVRSLSDVASKAVDRQLASSLAAEDAVDLMRELNAEGDIRVAAVEAELIRRGFSAAQLDLARRMFDVDPAVRKKLVQDLPDLQGVDAVPWLLRFCRDTDAEVRLAAITFLATSSDPAVLDQIEQIAGRDADSSVRRVADRISQQRNAQR